MRSMQSDNTDAGSEGTFHTVAVTLPGGDGRGSYDAAGEGVYGIEVADDQAVDSPFPMSALDSTREGGQYVGEHPFDINNDDHRYSHLSQASIPSIPSLPTPNAPTFPSIPAALVASRPDSDSPPLVMRPPRADGNEPETGTGTEQGNMDIPDSKRASGDYSWGKKRQGRILDPRDFDLTGISPEMVCLPFTHQSAVNGAGSSLRNEEARDGSSWRDVWSLSREAHRKVALNGGLVIRCGRGEGWDSWKIQHRGGYGIG